jgi:tripartite-type tricarboxylate transporter receptor subunit TctC
MINRRRAIASLAAAAAFGFPGAASAQSYPGKPVHVVIAFPAGGPPDKLAAFLKNETAKWAEVAKKADLAAH